MAAVEGKAESGRDEGGHETAGGRAGLVVLKQRHVERECGDNNISIFRGGWSERTEKRR